MYWKRLWFVHTHHHDWWADMCYWPSPSPLTLITLTPSDTLSRKSVRRTYYQDCHCWLETKRNRISICCQFSISLSSLSLWTNKGSHFHTWENILNASTFSSLVLFFSTLSFSYFLSAFSFSYFLSAFSSFGVFRQPHCTYDLEKGSIYLFAFLSQRPERS